MAPLSPELTIELTVREEWGRILASLTKSLGDLQLAEDCLQEAVLAAIKSWSKQGVPKTPAAWLLTTAKRKAIDRFRTIKVHFDRQDELSRMLDTENVEANHVDLDQIPDKRLEMIFTCCHPVLEEKTRVALTLRTLGGLTVEEIAAVFLDKKEAMAQRLVRAKKQILKAGIAYEVPDKSNIQERLASVLKVIYIIFNEGYAAKIGCDFLRVDLSDEAIRLARIVVGLLEEQNQRSAEAIGLLALMLLHDARRAARTNKKNQLVALEHQDRAAWNIAKIKEGTDLVKSALKQQALGPYQLQAAISGLHASAKSWEETDWSQLEALYQLLYAMQPSPVIRLNQALIISYSKSVEEGLAMVNALEKSGELASYQPLYTAKADLLARYRQVRQARPYLLRALKLSQNSQEKEFLNRKLIALDLEIFEPEKLP